ncbi:hypothetical protein H6P81_000737 [Aristolochia fimbriata]|uniref:Small ribosomal subunit protein uS15c n=1 Tax=Aristolochia fimbriata TaxID=158543 RepID=A0AAV7F6D7_ARIFI|nr:hypothetical protein H6P81_000737 [Aristolochia fimbriata]
MAAMALRLRPKYRTLPTCHYVRTYCSSSPPPPPSNEDDNNAASNKEKSSESSSGSDLFNDIKARLRQSPPPRRRPQYSSPQFTATPERPSEAVALSEIRKNLAEFRARSAPPDQPTKTTGTSPISFQAIYQSNMASKTQEANTQSATPFDAIRESLHRIAKPTTRSPLKGAQSIDPSVIGSIRARIMENGATGQSSAQQAMPKFGEESEKKEDKSPSNRAIFVRSYSLTELGEKLKALRPDGAEKKNDWFSLSELNERLIKLREAEVEASKSWGKGLGVEVLRESLTKLKNVEENKKKPSAANILLGLQAPTFRTDSSLPPKDDLVEKYFHPDNMSAAEKLKLELERVRDDFKMSESDCGSTRVQIAQLTTKIKYLSGLLHKKDKHSRKGLVDMVQRRKKLLKYLRRTDWDSYCLVLSKLGLRDNVGYKSLA